MLDRNAPMLRHLHEFLDETSPATPEARKEASQFREFLIRRHTVRSVLEERPSGLLFGANALLVNPVTESAYVQWHPKAGRDMLPGGKITEADGNDPVVTALRELHEEAPIFNKVVTIAHLMGNPVLLDVHSQTSIIKGNPGTWWFFTIGFWVPPDFCQVDEGGKWVSLYSMLHGDDVANSRSAQRVLNDLAGIRRGKL